MLFPVQPRHGGKGPIAVFLFEKGQGIDTERSVQHALQRLAQARAHKRTQSRVGNAVGQRDVELERIKDAVVAPHIQVAAFLKGQMAAPGHILGFQGSPEGIQIHHAGALQKGQQRALR